jgi:hypothetical protein
MLVRGSKSSAMVGSSFICPTSKRSRGLTGWQRSVLDVVSEGQVSFKHILVMVKTSMFVKELDNVYKILGAEYFDFISTSSSAQFYH